jgi:hypothetical protein
LLIGLRGEVSDLAINPDEPLVARLVAVISKNDVLVIIGVELWLRDESAAAKMALTYAWWLELTSEGICMPAKVDPSRTFNELPSEVEEV